MAILESKDHFYDMSRAFVTREARRLAEAVKDLLGKHYPGEPVSLQPGDEDGPQPEGGRPGPSMLRLVYHSLTSDEMPFKNDGQDFFRFQSLYQLSVVAHMMMVKEDRDEQSISELLSRHGQKAAHARHAENREIAEAIKQWYRENHGRFRSMDAAAEAATKLQPVAFRTARKHIKAAANELKLRE